MNAQDAFTNAQRSHDVAFCTKADVRRERAIKIRAELLTGDPAMIFEAISEVVGRLNYKKAHTGYNNKWVKSDYSAAELIHAFSTGNATEFFEVISFGVKAYINHIAENEIDEESEDEGETKHWLVRGNL